MNISYVDWSDSFITEIFSSSGKFKLEVNVIDSQMEMKFRVNYLLSFSLLWHKAELMVQAMKPELTCLFSLLLLHSRRPLTFRLGIKKRFGLILFRYLWQQMFNLLFFFLNIAQGRRNGATDLLCRYLMWNWIPIYLLSKWSLIFCFLDFFQTVEKC